MVIFIMMWYNYIIKIFRKGETVMSDIITYKIADNINFYYLKDCKYKTSSVCISLKTPLKRETVTKNSLIAKVLKRGTAEYNSIDVINPYLEKLYGARYDVFTAKRANIQFLSSAVSTLSDCYAGEKVFEKALKLALDFLYAPYLVNGTFKAEYVCGEKQNLKDDIESEINDKRSYAVMRCKDIMCEGSINAVHNKGYTEDLDGIDENNLYSHYINLVKTSAVDIFAVGDIDFDGVCEMLKDYFKKLDISPVNIAIKTERKYASEVKNVTEEMDVNQGKLAMGFTTEILGNDDDYYAFLVGNSIYGSGAHSKLFNNVREKMSLCYYVYSKADKLASLMIVGAGIEFESFDKAKSEILNQLNDVKNGNFTDEEMGISKKFLINIFKSYNDNQYILRDFYYTGMLCGNLLTIPQVIERINSVTREQINAAFKKINLNTVYFLKGKENK